MLTGCFCNVAIWIGGLAARAVCKFSSSEDIAPMGYAGFRDSVVLQSSFFAACFNIPCSQKGQLFKFRTAVNVMNEH